MARLRIHLGRKRRTRGHVLADLSANYVEKQALLCGYTAERVRLDYGIDMYVRTFNRRGEVENSWISFQFKATDRIKSLAGGSAVACRLERADLAHWLEEPTPVVLVLYDGRRDIGYWLHVQHHFASLSGFELARCGQRVTVAVPLINVLDPGAMRTLARRKNASLGGYGEVDIHAV